MTSAPVLRNSPTAGWGILAVFGRRWHSADAGESGHGVRREVDHHPDRLVRVVSGATRQSADRPRRTRPMPMVLDAPGEEVWWGVNDDGTVQVERPAGQAADLAEDVSVLPFALVQAEITVQNQENDAVERDRVLRERKAEYELAIQAVEKELPNWVENIECSNDGVGHGQEEWALTTTEEVAGLRFGNVA